MPRCRLVIETFKIKQRVSFMGYAKFGEFSDSENEMWDGNDEVYCVATSGKIEGSGSRAYDNKKCYWTAAEEPKFHVAAWKTFLDEDKSAKKDGGLSKFQLVYHATACLDSLQKFSVLVSLPNIKWLKNTRRLTEVISEIISRDYAHDIQPQDASMIMASYDGFTWFIDRLLVSFESILKVCLSKQRAEVRGLRALLKKSKGDLVEVMVRCTDLGGHICHDLLRVTPDEPCPTCGPVTIDVNFTGVSSFGNFFEGYPSDELSEDEDDEYGDHIPKETNMPTCDAGINAYGAYVSADKYKTSLEERFADSNMPESDQELCSNLLYIEAPGNDVTTLVNSLGSFSVNDKLPRTLQHLNGEMIWVRTI